MNADFFWKMVKGEVDRQKTSFEWLYRKTGIPKGTFSSWKTRNIIPRADEAYLIAEALGVSVEYLLSGREGTSHASNPSLEEIVKSIISFDQIDLDAVNALADAMSKRYKK
ncbi:putative bacteriophage CI repressor protein [Treponema primitia ZAS-2]|uniref:Putative bacteriophage CI repressor protein n=1 Tax=Treponema primitia (strain ATCC BAA-887 / DSM 12427 / ZAS-2) TaxID=545694 RepID=F5YI55_TREPZ|nr:helix-turn-helix domain-containing protein [Treponema primitia]AEF86153.1 putative bacteriophage CI repressor protein [Treponema primitia ZAS-2]